MTAFDPAFALEVLPLLAYAFLTAVRATFYFFVIASVLGSLFSLARRSPSKLFCLPTVAFLQFIRSTPLLVAILLAYFVSPPFGSVLSAFVTVVIVIGVH